MIYVTLAYCAFPIHCSLRLVKTRYDSLCGVDANGSISSFFIDLMLGIMAECILTNSMFVWCWFTYNWMCVYMCVCVYVRVWMCCMHLKYFLVIHCYNSWYVYSYNNCVSLESVHLCVFARVCTVLCIKELHKATIRANQPMLHSLSQLRFFSLVSN